MAKIAFFLVAFSVVAGCAAKSAGTTGTAATDAASGADATSGGDSTTAAATDVKAPVRNAQCEQFDDKNRGKKVPWGGYSTGKLTFTCNNCRGGDPILQGTWRQIDFKTEDPATSMGDDKDVITVDGNTWHEHIAGMDGGKLTDSTIDGWYFCTDKAEGLNKDELWIMDKVTPAGAFGNSAGGNLRVSALSNGANLLALVIYDAIDVKTTKTYNYCRVGSTIKGHPCNDPFLP